MENWAIIVYTRGNGFHIPSALIEMKSDLQSLLATWDVSGWWLAWNLAPSPDKAHTQRRLAANNQSECKETFQISRISNSYQII